MAYRTVRRRVRRRTSNANPKRRVVRRRRAVNNAPRRRVRRRRIQSNMKGWFKRRGKRWGRRGIARRFRGGKRYTRPRRRRVLQNNPPKRRRSSRRRRSYSANPGRRRVRLLANPIGAITDIFEEAFSGETLETVFHTGLGFGGTLVGSRLIYKQLITGLGDSALGRIGTTLGVSILGGALLGMIGGPKLGVRALGGGMLATLWAGLSEAVKDTKAADWIPTLGEGPESAEFRQAIEAEVLKELRGGGMSQDGEETEEGMSVYLQPAGVSETYLSPAGSQTYLTSGEAERSAGMATYLTRQNVVASEAGVGDSDSEFGGESLPERF
jgi:hypothetical protein